MALIDGLVYDPSAFTPTTAEALLREAGMQLDRGMGACYLDDAQALAPLQDGLHPNQSPVWRSRGLASSAIPDAAIVTMARNVSQTIGPWLRYYHTLGFRKFVLIDHASTDDSARIAAATANSLDDTHLLIVDEQHRDHYQRELVTGGARLALARWPDVDWIFGLDSDEYLSVGEPLGAISQIANGHNQIRLPWVDQVSALAVRQARRLLAGGGDAEPSPWTDIFDRGQLVFIYKVALSRSALQDHSFAQGNHYADGLDLGESESGLAHGLIVRHASNIDAMEYVAKAYRAVEAGYADPTRHRIGGDEWVGLARLLVEHGERAVIKNWTDYSESKLSTYRSEPASVGMTMLHAMGRDASGVRLSPT